MIMMGRGNIGFDYYFGLHIHGKVLWMYIFSAIVVMYKYEKHLYAVRRIYSCEILSDADLSRSSSTEEWLNALLGENDMISSCSWRTQTEVGQWQITLN